MEQIETKRNDKLNAKTFAQKKNERNKKLLDLQITMRLVAIVLHVVLCCRHEFLYFIPCADGILVCGVCVYTQNLFFMLQGFSKEILLII